MIMDGWETVHPEKDCMLCCVVKYGLVVMFLILYVVGMEALSKAEVDLWMRLMEKKK